MTTTAKATSLEEAAQTLKKQPVLPDQASPKGVHSDEEKSDTTVPPTVPTASSAQTKKSPKKKHKNTNTTDKANPSAASTARPAGYSSWAGMKQRCTNKNHEHYKDYGGRGITYSANWETFADFIKEMGPPPSSQATLDRVDVNDEYAKWNCLWATPKEQARNRRSNKLLEYKGKSYTLADLAERSDMEPGTLAARLKTGMSVEKAVQQPVQRGGLRIKATELLTSAYDRWPASIREQTKISLEENYNMRVNREATRPQYYLEVTRVHFEEACAILSVNPDEIDEETLTRTQKFTSICAEATELLKRHKALVKADKKSPVNVITRFLSDEAVEMREEFGL